MRRKNETTKRMIEILATNVVVSQWPDDNAAARAKILWMSLNSGHIVLSLFDELAVSLTK